MSFSPTTLALSLTTQSSGRLSKRGRRSPPNYIPFRLDRRLNRVKLTVREFTDGDRQQYAVDFVEMVAGPDRYTAPAGIDVETSPRSAAQPGPSIEVVDLLRGVKYGDSNRMLKNVSKRSPEDGIEIATEPVDQALPKAFMPRPSSTEKRNALDPNHDDPN